MDRTIRILGGFVAEGRIDIAPLRSTPIGSTSGTPGSPAPRLAAEVLDGARAGEPGAVATVVDACLPPVHAVCRRMLGPEAASDVAQDAIVRILGGLAGFDGRSAITTWATRIAINACLGHLRRERHRRHAPLDPGGDGGPDIAGRIRPESGEPGPSAGIQREEAMSAVQRALDGLDPDARAILVLRDLQGLDYEQIADVLEVRTGTVKSRLFRARAALRERLSDLGHGPRADQDGDDDGRGDTSARRPPAGNRSKRTGRMDG